MPIQGSCLCGGVRFEIDRAIGPVEYCHCNRCRKVSGSSALLSLVVRREDYRFLSGADLLRSYSAPILYAPPAYATLFCSRCGCLVPPATFEGEMLEIPVGLFDADPGVRADKHIMVDFAPPWDPIRDALPGYTLRQILELRAGTPVPPNFQRRRHATATHPTTGEP